jgi:XXXCH domain-containing protein
MQCQIKVDKVLTGPEASTFLKRLAEGLEKGQLVVGDTVVDIDNSIELAEILEVEGDRVTFDLKVNYSKNAGSEPASAPSAPPAAAEYPPPYHSTSETADAVSGPYRVASSFSGDGAEQDDDREEMKPSFKKLKKKMAKSFKSILDVLQNGEIPKLDVVGAYCGDADVMTSILDKGEEEYRVFRARCRELLEAVEHGDVNAAVNAAGMLNQMRRECHARHK